MGISIIGKKVLRICFNKSWVMLWFALCVTNFDGVLFHGIFMLQVNPAICFMMNVGEFDSYIVLCLDPFVSLLKVVK